MSHAGYVLGAWGIAFSAAAVYAIYVIRLGRRLAARVDPSRRRWMTTSSESSVDANAEALEMDAPPEPDSASVGPHSEASETSETSSSTSTSGSTPDSARGASASTRPATQKTGNGR